MNVCGVEPLVPQGPDTNQTRGRPLPGPEPQGEREGECVCGGAFLVGSFVWSLSKAFPDGSVYVVAGWLGP